MAYQALYRTYRPRRFSQMAGQTHVTTILMNQVREGQLSHAYLFCGSRGTGKTTAARILARAINCLHPENGEPCLACESCRLAESQTGDIVEIDAASNNGVENVRELISQAQFAPLQLAYRVFIIDEVHMLSGPAFNALLKTLEEPPAHVVFILATTEPQKLPATIISRCQRFDFHRLSLAELIGYMQYVLAQVGADISPDGLRLVARAAEGGMRDALSLLDQCLSACGPHLSTEDVESVLGVIDEQTLFSLSEHLLAGHGREALLALDEVVRRGRDLSVFAGDLSGHIRALLLSKTCGPCQDILMCTEDKMARYEKQAARYPAQRLLYAMEQLAKVQSDMRYFPSPRLLLESVLVRIAQPVDDTSPEALLARVSLLEERLLHGPAPAAPAASEPEDYLPEPPLEDYLPEPPAPSYWDEPREPEPKSQPEPKKKPEPAPQQPKAEPAPAAEPAAKEPLPSSQEADRVWKQVLQKLEKINGLTYRYAAFGQAKALTEEQLVVGFLEEHSNKLSILNGNMNQLALRQAMESVCPGVHLVLRAGEKDEAADLIGLFKDKLTIS